MKNNAEKDNNGFKQKALLTLKMQIIKGEVAAMHYYEEIKS